MMLFDLSDFVKILVSRFRKSGQIFKKKISFKVTYLIKIFSSFELTHKLIIYNIKLTLSMIS